MLANKGIIATEDWYHDPILVDCEKYTVAMILASNKIIASGHWLHNTYLRGNNK